MLDTRLGQQTDSAAPFCPAVPVSLDDAGLSRLFLEQLILKVLYLRGEMNGRKLADTLALIFRVIDPVLQELQAQYLVEVKNSLGYGPVSSVFGLTIAGRNRARECAEVNQYCGAAPVPLSQYVAGVEAQRRRKGSLTREKLAAAYRHMVVSDDVLNEIGPAVSAGRTMLIFGDPGNGKTYLAEALAGLESDPVYIPHAIEHNGSIIRVYNPLQHQEIRPETELFALAAGVLGTESPHDTRWVRCRRPFLMAGGELSADMLELSYHPTTKVYEAPLHLKANNGTYLIDDFGRQRITPAELLNRWIVPLESRMDHLRTSCSGTLSIPFELFLIFSTNLEPRHIGDEAFLRRIQYKLFVRNPDRIEFLQIAESYCAAHSLPFSLPLFDRFLAKNYIASGKVLRRCHPRDILSHALDLIEFERSPRILTDDILDRAFQSCFAGS